MGVEWAGHRDKFSRRRLVLVLIVSALVLIAVAIREGVITDEPPPETSPDILTIEPNGTTDGRYHTCGFVTEHGVTEHLDAYAARCGDLTYASDTKENG